MCKGEIKQLAVCNKLDSQANASSLGGFLSWGLPLLSPYGFTLLPPGDPCGKEQMFVAWVKHVASDPTSIQEYAKYLELCGNQLTGGQSLVKTKPKVLLSCLFVRMLFSLEVTEHRSISWPHTKYLGLKRQWHFLCL